MSLDETNTPKRLNIRINSVDPPMEALAKLHWQVLECAGGSYTQSISTEHFGFLYVT